MRSFVLCDVAHDIHVEPFRLGNNDPGLHSSPTFSVTKRTLRGGKRDGVELITIDNGRLAFDVVPTRGMGIWSARLNGQRIGWQSPVTDGPVHPAFVEPSARGGLGWLGGFDELLARCGLATNGPPVFDDAGRLVHGLHGRVANVPAHYVAVHVDEKAPHTITVEGRVDETELFFTQLRLTTRIVTTPGSNRLTVRDEITNLHDTPATFQLLYHWNFGPPHMEEGARFVAPVATLCPRDMTTAEGIGHYDVYGGPHTGAAEQVFYFTLIGDDDGRTVALLRNRAGDKGVALRFPLEQLPCFSLWKCTQGLREGYVTGLEPAVNYPNAHAFEAARGRAVALAPGASYRTEVELEAIASADAIRAIESEIADLQARRPATIHAMPVEPLAPAG